MDDTKELMIKFEQFINSTNMVHNKGDNMSAIKTQNVIKYKVFSYWDELQAQQNKAINTLINAKPYTMYGENQDFVSATIAAMMPRIGYIRPETVSVYFRQYKNKCRKVKQDLNKALGQ